MKLIIVFCTVLALALAERHNETENYGCVSRGDIMGRAQKWVNEKVPYSQSSYHDGYRQDCSGYVSFTWQASPSETTGSMPGITAKISKSELQQGDCILKPGTHVLLFGGWINSDAFHEFAEHQPGDVCRESQGSYNYYISNGYYPARYNHVC